jgi:hypothetical protein
VSLLRHRHQLLTSMAVAPAGMGKKTDSAKRTTAMRHCLRIAAGRSPKRLFRASGLSGGFEAGRWTACVRKRSRAAHLSTFSSREPAIPSRRKRPAAILVPFSGVPAASAQVLSSAENS